MDDYLTTLLDGHHKALAAAVDSQDVNALVIKPGTLPYRRQLDGQGKDFAIEYRMGDMRFSGEDLQLTEREQKKLAEKRLQRNQGGRRWTLGADQMNRLQQEMLSTSSEITLPLDTQGLANAYPTAI